MENKRRKGYFHGIFILFGCVFALASCATGPVIVSPSYKIEVPKGPIEKIPLRAGLYLSPSFQRRVFVGNLVGAPHGIAIGGAMTTGAVRTMKTVFRETAVIENDNTATTWKEADVIVSPEILETNYRGFAFSHAETFVMCKWTIAGRDGRTYYVNTITGKGYLDKWPGGPYGRDKMNEAMVLAIQDHYQKLAVDLLKNKWWESIGPAR
ncbi:MAG: hypothetical protein M1377_07155 [Deltaproteobacteria bacterium]|nr:hypothetical protein [Deltaproteobacteria bacterium]